MRYQLIPSSNPFGFPYFSSILEKLFKIETSFRTCSYFGYVNGDILLDLRLPSLLREFTSLSSSSLSPLLIGKRTNIHFPPEFSLDEFLPDQYQHILEDFYRREEQFLGLAMDYFLFTRTTFDNTFRPDVVIGRDMIDSYIFHYGYVSPHVQLVDISDSCR